MLLRRHAGKSYSKSFSNSKCPNALDSAILWRNANMPPRQWNSSTGVVGVTRTFFANSNDNLRYYIYAVKLRLGGKQHRRVFTYAVENLVTGATDYTADLEFKAFRVACHYRHLLCLYKRDNIVPQCEDINAMFPNLKHWRTLPTDLLFL